MVALSSLFHCLLYSRSQADPNAAGAVTSPSDQRPIYAIAHRVLRPQGVTLAVSHGANAIEVDLTAWKDAPFDPKWWADHDATGHSAGADARELFEFIAGERKGGAPIAFVWLDIKNPDFCAFAEMPCSIESLRDTVRQTLEPAGIRALYGFYGNQDSRALKIMRNTLNANEAIVLNGMASDVLDSYAANFTRLPVKQKVMDYGWTQLYYNFGDCNETTGNKTCAQLRDGAKARDQGKLGKVFGWTSTWGDGPKVQSLLGTQHVDGIIYGPQESDYEKAEEVARNGGRELVDFVKQTPNLRMATVYDVPW
ncbi:uncharacterized protein BDV14DRAFT_209241 [Aspergillus stella-maris]|uniref:uncharacterized protein n=1 Tax=Aspergillus stella-maris TaxID=1810926 RepID=UPI003CCD64F1